ncbi:MAG: oligosaccharyl transferase, archaeosortase A system-associated, partial [Methanomicrobiales archaeon]|nr:oligosaccharyl transferase, archaeosortase A system-associated [Methanomicrobiales archaeon]
IQEMQPWSLLSAWHNFNVLPLLMAGGFVVLFLHLKAGVRPEEMFIGVWGAFLLAMTALHSRFEYYLAVPLILLSSLFIVEALVVGLPALRSWMGEHRAGTPPREPPRAKDSRSPRQRPEKKKKGRDREKPKVDRAGRGREYALLGALVLALVAIAVIISLVQAIESGMDVPSTEIHEDWMESLVWMENHTPSPGVDYYGTYDPATFSYPPGSYGVLATWDAGHWITFFSRRIPNTNPFQDNLMGADGSAAFLLTPSEDKAETILDSLGTRYVITDAWTATDGFSGMVPWADPSLNITSYFEAFFVPDSLDPGSLGLYEFYTDDYFLSTMARLHFFDGSLTLPTTVRYLEYTVRQVPGPGETAPMSTVGPVVTRIENREAAKAEQDAAQVNANSRNGIHAAVVSDAPDRPTIEVPALSRFRLVHESPSDVAWEYESGETQPEAVKYVKVFEYVRGARIRGEGTIELPLVTNTGRAFTYRAESVNGEFVVPYSTEGNPYEVRATGPYRISGSDRTVQVTEDEVRSGGTVVP